MKKCPYCAQEIQVEAVQCGFCSKMLTQTAKWYHGTLMLIPAFLLGGPLALPLFWKNPKYSRKIKILVTAIVIITSALFAVQLVKTLRSISHYYQAMAGF